MTVGRSILTVSIKWLSLSWLTGPILDKELRVSSRRRQNYWLRTAFLGLMTLIIVLVWVAEVQVKGIGFGSNLTARMSEVGKTIIVTIVVFQFCALQLLAIVMLSNSIRNARNAASRRINQRSRYIFQLAYPLRHHAGDFGIDSGLVND
ncbi:MAG: hypothetical protein AMJ79_02670 [Phycisphaerae bacterium SM23_30]|nr:MAG: hypothetical protein AMJ79_02670 [Phycisphaerae bacterium SM23_30]